MTRNAPGGRTNREMWNSSGISGIPAKEPAPMISRKPPRRIRAKVKPRPMPMPSNRAGIGFAFSAYASARPRMMQLTTISGM